MRIELKIGKGLTIKNNISKLKELELINNISDYFRANSNITPNCPRNTFPHNSQYVPIGNIYWSNIKWNTTDKDSYDISELQIMHVSSMKDLNISTKDEVMKAYC